MPELDYSQPAEFAWDSPELQAYLRAAAAAGYEALVELRAQVRCRPGTPLRPLAPADLGIDVSHWQQPVLWPQVAAAGLRFAFIKATEGRQLDSWFTRHWEGARAAHLHCGAYMFFLPGMLAEAQAEAFINVLTTYGHPTDLRPAVDVEYTEYMGAPRPDEWLLRLERVLLLIEQATGQRPYLYTNSSALQQMFQWHTRRTLPSWAGQYPLWVAHYTDRAQPQLPRGWTKCQVWQFDNGDQLWSQPVPGIGKCDRNRWVAGC